MGLDLADALRADLLDSRDAVRLSAFPDRAQAGQLVLGQRDHELAAETIGNRPGPRELFDRRLAFAAEPRFAGSRSVVETGMQDPAVVPRLVPAELRFLLEDREPQRR